MNRSISNAVKCGLLFCSILLYNIISVQSQIFDSYNSCSAFGSHGGISILLYLGNISCESCKVLAVENVRQVADRYPFCKPVLVQFINRAVDTSYHRRFFGSDLSVAYRTYDSFGIQLAKQKEFTWECSNGFGKVVGTGTILTEKGIGSMYHVLDSMKARIEGNVQASFIATLDEKESPLIMPIYSSRIVDNLIAIADEGRRTVGLYSCQTGGKVYERMISDSLLADIPVDGEKFYSGIMNSPRLRAVDVSAGNIITVLGSVPVQKLKEDGKIHVYSRMYYCRIDCINNDAIVRRIEDVCEQLSYYTYENSYIRGDTIIVTSPTWRLSETAYDSLYCLAHIDLKSCSVMEYAKLDDIYKQLDIGENFCTGHMAIVAGTIYTTQTLSPWIIQEKGGMRIAKNDSLFRIQSASSKKDGADLAKSGDSPFERSMLYSPRIYTIAFFPVADRFLVDVSYCPGEDQAKCMVYDTEMKRIHWTGPISTGGFLQAGDSGFVVVTKEKDEYNIYRYDVER